MNYIQFVYKATTDPRYENKLYLSHQCDYGYFLFLAYEILGNKLKRRSYDSVDPQFDNDVPPADEESKKNFFKVFGPVFERNSR